ncbi:DUF4040 domain-containing protein [bacterium]|nr:DUF4040 domain-containing protein [bacterium]
MITLLFLLLGIMILGAIVALESRDLLSSIICLGIIGYSLTIIFVILQAPDLAIVQIIIETLTLVILIAAVLKTNREDTTESFGWKKMLIWGFGLVVIFLVMMAAIRAYRHLPAFASPGLQLAAYYLDRGLALTGAANIVAAIILDFRGYDTLGEATVLFTAVVGTMTVLRKTGRKEK